MKVYVVAPGNLETRVSQAAPALFPAGTAWTFVSEEMAGTVLKQELIESATHLVVLEPRAGGLSLVFGLLRRPYHPDLPKLLIITRMSIEPLLEMADPDERKHLESWRSARALILAADVETSVATRFFGSHPHS